MVEQSVATELKVSSKSQKQYLCNVRRDLLIIVFCVKLELCIKLPQLMLDEAPMGCENQLCCFSRKAKQPFLWWESLLDKQQDLPVDFHGSKAFGWSNAMHNCHLRCFKEFCTAACTTAVKSSSACLPITDWFSFLL